MMASTAFQTQSTGTDLEAQAPTVGEITQSLCGGASPTTREQLALSHWAVGSATMVMGMTTAFHLPPAGPVFGPAVYYAILVFILASAAAEMATAFLLPRSTDGLRLHAFAKRLLPFAYVVLLIAVSASGFAIPFKLPPN